MTDDDQAELDRLALEEIAEAEGLTSTINVITISYDNENPSVPQVDLGDAHPYFAQALLQDIARSLSQTTPWPQITYRGDVIFAPHVCGPECFEDDDDEDGEDLI